MANAKKKREQAEWVARVEGEIRIAQREGSQSRKVSQVKATFSRNASFEDQVNEASHVSSVAWLDDSPPF